MSKAVVLQVFQQVLNDQGQSLIDSLTASVAANKASLENSAIAGRDRDLTKLWNNINGVSST